MDNKTTGNSELQFVIQKIRQVLIKFIKDFKKNPFQYFYEEDARASLYSLLKSEININKNFPAKAYSERLGIKSINSSIVKTEYPSYRRFDIAVLGYSGTDDYYNQPVIAAIELKLGSHKIHSDKTAGLKSDIIKLKDYLCNHRKESFLGLAIYFCQTDIEKDEIDKWYKDLSETFKSVEVNQLFFEANNVYALIVPANFTNHIYMLQI